MILGFNTEHEVFYKEEFEKLGAEVLVATADGSMGKKGFVTDVLRNIKEPAILLYMRAGADAESFGQSLGGRP